MEGLAAELNHKISNLSELPVLTHQGISISVKEINEEKGERKNHNENLQKDFSIFTTVNNIATLQVKKRLKYLTEDLKELWNINVNQERALGLLDPEKENEVLTTVVNEKPTVTFFSNGGVPSCQISTVKKTNAISSNFGTRENELPHQKSVLSVNELPPESSEGEINLSKLEFVKVTSEREGISRLLAEAKNEIDDLKYVYEQKVHSLQEELNTYQGISVRLHELENVRYMECISASTKLSKCEQEVTTLRKLLVSSTEKGIFITNRKEGVEERTMSQINSLEDALGTAVKMDAVLLENA
ncbi:hypothetical protein LSM04_005382 [Trypanosoma melophagium]|uniref:uncharacterized protein n=1 Tax=Trypanosoma melophagium TaxID=715481 RepID=UPI00351A1AB6|nr:hypothetical protein LSM04_005382 [Trypanosoma melophagium]